MCDVQSAIAVVGAVQGYREKKAQNKAISRDQETSRRHADKGYLHDLNKIDQEKINADMERTKSEISIKAEREKEIAQKTNLGFGNGVKIVQSMGQLYDEDWLEVTSLYDKDMQSIDVVASTIISSISVLSALNFISCATPPSSWKS